MQGFPERVLPERRKKQSYISSVLSGNEIDRNHPYNRKLFKRISRGNYIINPNLKLRFTEKQKESWVNVYGLLQLDDLGVKHPVGSPSMGQHTRTLMREHYHKQWQQQLQEMVVEIKGVIEVR